MKLWKSFTHWLNGIEDEHEPIESLSLNQMDPPFVSLSQYLNYAGYEDGLFSLMDEDQKPLGCAFTIELNPLLGANDELIGKVGDLFSILPANTPCQLQLFGSPDLRHFFHAYRDIQGLRPDDDPRKPVFQALANKRMDFWQKGTQQLLIPGTAIRLRRMRLILTVNLNDTDFTTQASVSKALSLLDRMQAHLKSMGVFIKVWDADDLVKWCTLMLNPHRMFTNQDTEVEPQWDPHKLLKEQLIETRTVAKVLDTGTGIRFGAKATGDAVIARCYSVNRYPDEFHLAGMGGLIGDAVESNLNYTSPFLISTVFYKLPYDESYNTTTLKNARAVQVASSPMARIMPEAMKRKRDFEVCMAAFGQGGGGLVKMFNQVVLWERPDEINLAESQAIGIWQKQGFGLYRDQYLQAPAYLCALPMAYDKELLKHMDEKRRWGTKTLTNAICMAPLIGEWQGLGDPVIGLFGRRGQAMGIDIFANPSGNYNFAVIGGSGSGKSFFVNEIVRNYLGLGAQIWIIDVGRSYQKFSQMIGGQYIEFTYDQQLCFPPFQLVTDINEDIELLKLIFVLMASPSDNLTEQQEAKLQRIIQDVWFEHGNQATVDHVMQRCLDALITGSDSDGNPGERDLGMVAVGDQLYPYSTQGIYGRYFNGELNVEFKNELIILELEELKNKPDLQQIIMQLIMYMIMRGMYLSRSNYKIMMIDEAWALLGGSETTARFIEEGYRRVRKYKGACGTATQGANDYYSSPAAQAALENSDFVFHLRANPTSLEVIEEKKPFEVDPGVMRQLRSLSKTDFFSEVYVATPVGSGVGRLYSDPFNILASSSKAEDFEAVNYYRTQGLNTAQAIEAVLKDRGINQEQ